MPDTNSQSPNKKARLGRGLGSLLGGAPDLSTPEPEQPKQPVTTQSPAVEQPKAPVAAPNTAPITASANASVNAVTPVPTATIPDESQLWKIPIDRLVPNTQQPRRTFTPEALKELSASIKEKGILQPITARRLGEREFEIIAGERRWRAAQLAGLHEVPVLLRKVSEQDSFELAIIENIQREDLNPMEEAEAYDRLMREYSLTQQQAAEKLGKDRSSVANSLRLLGLPPELKELVRKLDLSTGHAKVLLSLEKSSDQVRLAKQIVDEKLSVRATEKLVAKTKTDTRQATSPSSSINVNVPQRLIDSLSAELQKLIGTKVTIDYADSKGRIGISFYSDDQLTQIVEKIRSAWEK